VYRLVLDADSGRSLDLVQPLGGLTSVRPKETDAGTARPGAPTLTTHVGNVSVFAYDDEGKKVLVGIESVRVAPCFSLQQLAFSKAADKEGFYGGA